MTKEYPMTNVQDPRLERVSLNEKLTPHRQTLGLGHSASLRSLLMKTLHLSLLFLLHAQLALPADDLTAALQQALFNEEADHDLTAAIKAYQLVVTGADAQRKLAATAVFRLGECNRKLGQTNEAVAQYQRILNDFTDQTNLVTLSRQNLAGLGVNTQRPRGKGMMGLTFNELLRL